MLQHYPVLVKVKLRCLIHEFYKFSIKLMSLPKLEPSRNVSPKVNKSWIIWSSVGKTNNAC